MEHREAKITINGVELDLGQSMTVRVAIADFLMELRDPESLERLGPIGPGYLKRLEEIQDMIFISASLPATKA